MTEGKVMTDAKPINCEWFGRPSIAVSEMAESICENVDVIERGLGELTADEVGTNLRQLAETMNALNKRNQIAPQPHDISAFMRYVLDDQEGNKEAFFEKLEVLGNAMFLTAIQYKMTKTIFHNLDWYTNMLNTCDGTDADVKRNADIRTMKDFLVNQCVEVVHTPTRNRSHVRNLLRELDDATLPVAPPQPPVPASVDLGNSTGSSSGDESQNEQNDVFSQQPSTSAASGDETITTKKKKRKNPLRDLADDSEEEQEPVKKKQKKKKTKKSKDD